MDDRGGRARPRSLLRIYLNDHLMAATGLVELARRAGRSNRGTALGTLLDELTEELREDRGALERLIGALGHRPDRLKVAAGVAAERLGRLKLNGSLVAYSDLSRLVELEGLIAGVHFNERLWLALRELPAADLPDAGLDLERLLGRAQVQQERLEEHRRRAAARALSATAGAA